MSLSIIILKCSIYRFSNFFISFSNTHTHTHTHTHFCRDARVRRVRGLSSRLSQRLHILAFIGLLLVAPYRSLRPLSSSIARDMRCLLIRFDTRVRRTNSDCLPARCPLLAPRQPSDRETGFRWSTELRQRSLLLRSALDHSSKVHV